MATNTEQLQSTPRKILVTGTAGFIGFHLAKRLLSLGDEVVGLDNINDYYDVQLKFDRLRETGISQSAIAYNHLVQSKKYPSYRFIQLNLEDREGMMSLMEEQQFDMVVNLAAQAGVRYSLTNPESYVQSNIVGFMNILEACRHNPVRHLVYASSSSVYGLNEKMPFSTSDNVDHPVSIYAASKKSNELMAHTYSHLYGLPTTGLRFFTVYGPGRPDMAAFLFTKAIMKNKPIHVFNNGDMLRDFTYVDDIVEGIVRVMDCPPAGDENWSGANPDPGVSKAPYRIFNIGNGNPSKLMDFVEALQECLGKKAELKFLPLQPGDVVSTFADVSSLEAATGYRPTTSVKEGIAKFAEWYKEYFKAEAIHLTTA